MNTWNKWRYHQTLYSRRAKKVQEFKIKKYFQSSGNMGAGIINFGLMVCYPLFALYPVTTRWRESGFFNADIEKQKK